MLCHFDNAKAFNADGSVALSSGITDNIPTSQSGDGNIDFDRRERLAYMSPEAARGEATLIPGKSDMFSIGIIAYQLMNGSVETTNPWGNTIASQAGEFQHSRIYKNKYKDGVTKNAISTRSTTTTKELQNIQILIYIYIYVKHFINFTTPVTCYRSRAIDTPFTTPSREPCLLGPRPADAITLI